MVWLAIVKKLNFVVTAGKIFGSVGKRKMLNLQASTAKQSVIWGIV